MVGWSVWCGLGALGLWALWGQWRRRRLPRGPPAVPLLGSLPWLRWDAPEESVRRWGRDFGGLFTLWLGPRPVLVLSRLRLLKEALLRQPDAFAARPFNFIRHYLASAPGSGDISPGLLDSQGPRRLQLRRWVVESLRSVGRLELSSLVRLEVERLVSELRPHVGEPVELKPLVGRLAGRLIARIVLGQTLQSEEGGGRDLMVALGQVQTYSQSVANVVLSAWPWLYEWLAARAVLDGGRAEGLRCRVQELWREEMALSRARWLAEGEAAGGVAACLFEEQGQSGDGPSDAEVSAVCLELLSVGVETTSAVLSWSLLLIARHPHVEARLRGELEAEMGRAAEGGPVKAFRLSQRRRLPYLRATVEECLRLANVFPLFPAHQTTEDVELRGWDIPAGTWVDADIGAVLASPDHFPEPQRFRPERFLDGEEGEEGGERRCPVGAGALVAFSLGRRQCPAEGLSRALLFLLLGSLVRELKPTPHLPSSSQPLRRRSQPVSHPHSPASLFLQPLS